MLCTHNNTKNTMVSRGRRSTGFHFEEEKKEQEEEDAEVDVLHTRMTPDEEARIREAQHLAREALRMAREAREAMRRLREFKARLAYRRGNEIGDQDTPTLREENVDARSL